MRDDWIKLSYKDIVTKIPLTNKKLKQKDYLQIGKIPVIDQGCSQIGGYTDDESKIVNCRLPIILFGDHTRTVKFIHFPFAAGADGIKVLEPKICFEPKLLKYFTEVIAGKIKNKGYARHYQDVETAEISLPSLLEQKAIVAKIEQLFSELDNGIANLKTAQAKLKIYRQAVLKKAFEGELTREWRERQTNLPTADELLEQIKQEREDHYKLQLEEWNQAVKNWETSGKDSKKPTKPKKYIEVIEKFDYIKSKIPYSWVWNPFGKLFLKSPQNGIYKPATNYGTGTYIIRIDDFYDGKLVKKNNFKRVRLDSEEINTYAVEVNSIFINRVNSMTYLGKCALVEQLDAGMVFESNIMKINTIVVNNKYVTIFLSSIRGMQNLQINAKQAVNQASINQTDVSSTFIPLCSLEEQNKIVQEIESRLSVCDKIEETIKLSLQKAESLRQSILKKAFEGRLLSNQELEAIKNHPGYESAAKLFERIKQERK